MDAETLARKITIAWLWDGDRNHLRFDPDGQQQVQEKILQVLRRETSVLEAVKELCWGHKTLVHRVRDIDQHALKYQLELGLVILYNDS